VEVSDYAPLVADVSQAWIKVCVVRDPRPLNNAPRPPRLSHWPRCLGDNGRSCTRTEVGFIISPRRTPRTKWEHTVGSIGVVAFTKRKARHVGAVVS
jgi:hypothetical protein